MRACVSARVGCTCVCVNASVCVCGCGDLVNVARGLSFRLCACIPACICCLLWGVLPSHALSIVSVGVHVVDTLPFAVSVFFSTAFSSLLNCRRFNCTQQSSTALPLWQPAFCSRQASFGTCLCSVLDPLLLVSPALLPGVLRTCDIVCSQLLHSNLFDYHFDANNLRPRSFIIIVIVFLSSNIH